MKKILFIILLCLNIQLTYGVDYSPYSNRYGGYNSVPTEQTYRRIGYTSQYGGGFSNPKSTIGYPQNMYINPKSTFGKTTYDNYHSNAIYPGNTYDNYHSNYSSGGSGRPGGQPRRVIGYTADGDSINTGSGTQGNPDPMWEDGYEYYWDGKNWYRWNGKRGWEWLSITGLYYHWSIFSHDVPPGATQLYEQNPVPIGDDLVPLSLLCLGYVLYRRRSNFFV